MKFEITKKVKTPDGVEHDSVEAAHKHMWSRNLELIAAADLEDLKEAVERNAAEEGVPADIVALRHALREVFLAAWPRASKGQPRKPKEAASEAPPSYDRPSTEGQSTPRAASDEEMVGPTPKRSHGKKAA